MGQTAARPSGTRPIVLILGGGYAGVTLAKLLDESGCCFVLLVDQKEFFLHTVGTPRALVAKHFAHRLLIPYDRLLKNGVVIHGVVQSITPREVTLHGRPAPIHFDFLCIATGAHYNFPYQLQQHFSPAVTPSLLEHHHADNHRHPSSTSDGVLVAEHTSSLPVPQPMFMMDTLSAYAALFDAVQSARRVLVVGGGCVGVETAGELVARFGREAARAREAQAAKATAAVTAAAAATTTPTEAHGTMPEASAASNSPPTIAAPAPAVDADFKHVTLLHSGATLLNRQTGMREKMREMLLAALKSKGVQVELLQRAQLDVLREVRADGTETARSKDVSRLLHNHGFLRAEPGCSLLVPAVNAVVAAAAAAAALAGDASHAASQGAAASYATDLVVLATGLRHDGPSSALFRSDPEISTCLDARGRLVVNKFFQLDGQVCPERARASATRGAAAGSGASGERTGGPGSDSGLHTRFSFHYPRIFALGDCAVPRDELGQDLAPQAYLAHRHAQAVARNIQNMLSQCALVPYGGAGPLALFVSLGPEYGASQLPNRQSTLAGDVMTRGLKSADMQCAANWAFLNQDENKPSFKAHASQRFVEQQPRGVQSALPPQPPEDHAEPAAAATAADQATSSEPHLVTADASGTHDPHRPHSPSSSRNHSSSTHNLTSPSSPAYASVSSLSLHLHPQPVTSLSKPSLPAPTLLPDHHRTAAAPQPTIHAVLMHEQQKHVEEKLAAEAAEQQKHKQLHAVSQEQAVAEAHERPASADVALPVPVACTSAASPHRPAGTESLSVAVRGASVVPSSSVNRVSSPSASSPIGPILLPGSESERQFEEAMASERDQLEEDEEEEGHAGPLKTDARDQELVLEESEASAAAETTAAALEPASHSSAASYGHVHATDSQSLDVHLQSFAQSNPFDDGEFAAEPAPTTEEAEAAATAVPSTAGAASGHVHGAVAPAPLLSPLPEGLEEESLVSPESARAVRPLGPSVEKYDGRAFLRFAKPNNAHDGQAGAVDDQKAEEDGSANVQHASEDY